MLGCTEEHGAACRGPNPPYNPLVRQCVGCDVSCALGGHCAVYAAFAPATMCCGVVLRYGDASFALGPLLQAPLSFGPRTLPGFVFMGATQRGRFADTPVDGILGLAYHALNPAAGSDFVSQMAAAAGAAPLFSLCLSQQGGALVVSDNVTELTQYAAVPARVTYVPLTEPHFYSVALAQISVESYPSPLLATNPQFFAQQRTIVDSGTSFFLVPFALLQALQSTMLAHYDGVQGVTLLWGGDLTHGFHCVEPSQVDLDALPPLTMAFANGASVSLPPRAYVEVLAVGAASCVRVALGVPPQGVSGIILGDPFMRAFVTVFDRSMARVGFAPVGDCPSPLTSAVLRNATALEGFFAIGVWTEPLSMQVVLPAGSDPLPAGQPTQWRLVSGGASVVLSRVVATDGRGYASQRVLVTANDTEVVVVSASVAHVDGEVQFMLRRVAAPSSSEPGANVPASFYGVLLAALAVFVLILLAGVMCQFRAQRRALLEANVLSAS